MGDGIPVGWLQNAPLTTPAEDSLLVLGAQRSGKTSAIAIPALLEWTGAAVATSTKEELLKLTAGQRATHGPIYVFAPSTATPRGPTGLAPASSAGTRFPL